MEVLVCCKVVPDLDQLSEQDWRVQEGCGVDTSYVRNLVNPYDESALELALRFRDAAAGPVRVSALSIGDPAADPFLKTLRALRLDPVVRIEPRQDWRFCPEGIATMITAYTLCRASQDALVLGRRSGEGDHGKTPLLAAELLGWPCITEVLRFDPAGPDRLQVTSRVDGGRLVQRIRPPVVLSVGDVAGSALRVPTLKDRMLHGKVPVEVLTEEEFQLAAVRARHLADYRLDRLTPVDRRRGGRIVQGPSSEVARILFEEALGPWLERP
jgi:electron transfer flavoprotein alpha/beta subunit